MGNASIIHCLLFIPSPGFQHGGLESRLDGYGLGFSAWWTGIKTGWIWSGVFSMVDWNQVWMDMVWGFQHGGLESRLDGYGLGMRLTMYALTKCVSGKGSTFLHAEGLSCNLFSLVPLVVLLQAECIAGGGVEREGGVRGEKRRRRRREGRRARRGGLTRLG